MNRSRQWGQLCCCRELSSRGNRAWELSVGTTISSEGVKGSKLLFQGMDVQGVTA